MRTRYAVMPRALDVRRGPIGGIQYATFVPSFDRSFDPLSDRPYDPPCDPPWASSCDPSCDQSCDQSCNQSCNPSPLFVLREHQSHASLVVQTVSLRQLCSFSHHHHHHHHQYVACPEEGKINRVDSSSFVSTVYFSQLTSTGSQPSRNKVVKGHHTQVNQTNQYHTCNSNRTIRS